ncbi:MAG: peptidylprolyl isomerase, partial [Eubacterium sp.]
MAKKQLDEDLLTGGSLNSDGDKSAKKAEKQAAKAAKKREKNDAKRAAIKKQLDALKEEKAGISDEKELEKINKKIKKLSDSYSSVGSTDKFGVAPRTARIIKSAVCIVLVVALLAAYVCTGTVRKGFVASLGIPAQYFTGMTVSNGEQKAKIKVSTYNYYFAMAYNSLRSNQETYSQYGLDLAEYNMDVDFDKKFSQQTTKDEDGKEIKWSEYIYNQVLDSIEDTYTYYLEAVAANGGEEPDITEEQETELKDTIKEYRDTAEGYGYTLSGYLVKAMGKGVTESVFKTEARRSYIAENYKAQLQEEASNTEYSQDKYDEYKKEHADELTSVDIRLFECSNEDDAKAFKKALKADGSNFSELCTKYASSDFDKKAYEEDGYSTEYGVTKSTLQSKGYAIAQADPHNHEEGEEHSDDEEETYSGLDWLFSKDRKAGDIYQQSTTVVYVLSPASIKDTKTVNVRHILIAPETEDEDASAKDATDKQWSDAYTKAASILSQWKKGEKTEDSFAKLAEENTTDTGSADNGGLYENVVPGQMVNSFSAWCFEKGRKTGDTAIVRSDYGFHIMYFVGYGDLKVWEYTAQQEFASSDNDDNTSKLEEAYELKVNWLGSRYFEKDVD